MHWYAGTLTDKFVVRSFVAVLESPPSTDVVNQYCSEDDVSGHHIAQQADDPWAVLQSDAAPSRIRIGLHDLKSEARRVVADSLSWFSREYCCCSVDMRKYWAAGIAILPPELSSHVGVFPTISDAHADKLQWIQNWSRSATSRAKPALITHDLRGPEGRLFHCY